MTWHSDAINPTLATALLIAAGALALVTLTEAVRRNQKATKLADLKGPAVWYLSAIAVAVGVPLFLISTAKLFETLLTENPGDVRWISLLFLSIVGAPFVIWRSFVAQAQADTAAQGMITDRINKAVEGLGAEKTVKRPVRSSDGTLTYEEATEPNLEVRVGAVLALERIAKDSPDDHIQIMEILCAYIRENAPKGLAKKSPHEEFERLSQGDAYSGPPLTPEQIYKHAAFNRWNYHGLNLTDLNDDNLLMWYRAIPVPRADIQIAIKVLGRRQERAIEMERTSSIDNDGKGYRLDLRATNLQRVDMRGGNFAHARFARSRLDGADISQTNFYKANFHLTDLTFAFCDETNFEEARCPTDARVRYKRKVLSLQRFRADYSKRKRTT